MNKPLYLVAPFLAMTMALLSISVIPFGPAIEVAGYRTWMQLTDLNIGVLFVLAVSSMGVYGIALAGWSSNNKYALLGGLRSSAQMISYELPLSLAIAAPLLISNTLSLRRTGGDDRRAASWHWNILHGPFPQIFSFLIFLIAGFAETNRVPFDLPEAENELVAGFHTEYSSMKFASFFMAEYANMITVSSHGDAAVSGRLGGALAGPVRIELRAGGDLRGRRAWWRSITACTRRRRRDRLTLPVFGVVFLASRRFSCCPWCRHGCCRCSGSAPRRARILFAFMWVRGTLPRFRYDQLMGFTWKFLFPVAVAEPAGDRLSGCVVGDEMDVILFLIFAVIAVVCAINVVVQTHPISSAISLVGVMGSLAVLYLLLGAEFIAAAQVIVYAGAIMVLFVFVIMLLNAGRGGQARPVADGAVAGRAAAGRVARAAGVLRPAPVSRAAPWCISADSRGGTPRDIGRALFTTYLLPFEVTSILILIAIVGAIVLARKEMD